MQKIQNLIRCYKPLDFNSIDENLLEEFPLPRQAIEILQEIKAFTG